MREARAQVARSTPEAGAHVIHRPEPEGVRAERADDGYRARPSGRASRQSLDLSDRAGVRPGRLRRLGVDRELARAGARSGDIVHIGEAEFEYEPDADPSDRTPRKRGRR